MLNLEARVTNPFLCVVLNLLLLVKLVVKLIITYYYLVSSFTLHLEQAEQGQDSLHFLF